MESISLWLDNLKASRFFNSLFCPGGSEAEQSSNIKIMKNNSICKKIIYELPYSWEDYYPILTYATSLKKVRRSSIKARHTIIHCCSMRWGGCPKYFRTDWQVVRYENRHKTIQRNNLFTSIWQLNQND